MYLQEILEVAIGLVLVWLILSVATMSLQEWMGNLVNLRAKDLEKTISHMLGSKAMTQQFYQYPLITNLFQPAKNPSRKGRLPSYIPPDKFSATLFELIIQAGLDNSPVRTMTNQMGRQLVSIKSPEQQNLALEDWDAILETARNVAASGLGSAALDSLKFQVQTFGEKYPELKKTVDLIIPQLDAYYEQFVEEQRISAESGTGAVLAVRQFNLGRLALKTINPRLNESVTAIMKDADASTGGPDQAVAAIRKAMESWFNDAMDRLSGDYKRRAQFIAFVIGFILAVLLNVDSINVANRLWREPTLRQAIIAQTQSYSASVSSGAVEPASPLENIPMLEMQLQALNIPFGWSIAAINPGSRQCTLFPVTAGQIWAIPSLKNQAQSNCYGIQNLPVDLNGWLSKILGLFMTGLAAAQGAPFWFDILKKIINVRSAGASTAESKAVG